MTAPPFPFSPPPFPPSLIPRSDLPQVIDLVCPQYVGLELDAERAEKLMANKMYEDQGSRGLLATLRELMHSPGDIGQKVRRANVLTPPFHQPRKWWASQCNSEMMIG